MANVPLPHGWEAKFDQASQKWYFINHFTKTTQWEDPRAAAQNNPLAQYFFQIKPQVQRQAAHYHRNAKQEFRRQARSYQQQLNAYPVQRQPVQVNTSRQGRVRQPQPVQAAVDHTQQHVTEPQPFVKSLEPGTLQQSISEQSTTLKQPDAEEPRKSPQQPSTRSQAVSRQTSSQNRPDSSSNAKTKATQRLSLPGAALLELSDIDRNNLTTILHSYNVEFEIAKPIVSSHKNIKAIESILNNLGYKKKSVVNKELVQSLVSKFPTTPVSVVEEHFIEQNNSLEKTTAILEQMGFRRRRSLKRSTRSEQSDFPPQPQKVFNPVQAKREVKLKFPDLDEKMIEICLNSCNNDAEMAIKILKSKSQEKAKERKRLLASLSKPSPTPLPARSPTPSPKLIKKKSSDGSKVYESYESSSVQASFSPSTTSCSSDVKTKAEERGKLSPISLVTQSTEHPCSPTLASHLKQQGDYKSSLRLTPRGPDPTLWNGPDSSLLLKSHFQSLGPNKANYKGPNKEYCHGPDPANINGPTGLASGPSVKVNNLNEQIRRRQCAKIAL